MIVQANILDELSGNYTISLGISKESQADAFNKEVTTYLFNLNVEMTELAAIEAEEAAIEE